VGFDTDTGPSAFYAFDRSTRSGRFLFHTRPALTGYQLAPRDPISFTARDGLTIHGYVSFPPGVERRNLPLVLNVHGGPWHRDTWGYDPEAQWLTNRGYVSLQVNFRGSTGYGKHFLNAGDREWGGKMQDDLTDAVRWAVERGFADPGRVAIYGGSYGGYAALAGAAFTPDLFCCAVDIVGPSNLLTFIDTIPPYWSAYLSMMHRRVGHPEKDRDFLVARSPLNSVHQIRIPLLIAQGANDPRVKQSESEQIVAALKEKGIEYEYLLFPDEGHGFAKPENRLKFYEAAERFLARHLGGRSQA
jgi:dipeptidyl aminopeptidase/acylaminoacyl peptidase